MSGQYFENNQDLKRNIHKISYYYKEHIITLFADNGVFSKDKIDFGSNLLLKSIKLIDGKKILDVGCGYGTIGLTLATIYPNSIVHMVDVNDRALELAKIGKEENKINNVEIYHSDVYENVHDTFDYIISNPPIRAGKIIVQRILKEAYEHLNNNGILYFVIQKKQGAESAKKVVESLYQNVEIINNDKGYLIFIAEKIVK